MEEETIVPKIKAFITYIAKRKKPWAVAVFDKKTKKRAVGDSLPEVLEKIPNDSPDLVIIDKKEFDQQAKKT